MGQANSKPVLPGQRPHRENRGRRARVDGQAHGGRNDPVN